MTTTIETNHTQLITIDELDAVTGGYIIAPQPGQKGGDRSFNGGSFTPLQPKPRFEDPGFCREPDPWHNRFPQDPGFEPDRRWSLGGIQPLSYRGL